MPLENLNIRRICLHEVHRRSDEGTVVPPTYSAGLLNLQGRAREAFRSRVIAAFKSAAQCMDMTIRQFGLGSAISNGVGLTTAADPEFIILSKQFADSLASAQTSRSIPGGLAVVFDGTVGHPEQVFFGVMKAELHEGFLKTDDLQAQFVNDLFLSPKTKLYKIGIFISDSVAPRPELPAGWLATVYDSHMTAAHRDNAATYFHSNFLGLDIPDNAAQQVKKFFEKTRDFIRSSKLGDEDKIDLLNGLYTYLKVDQRTTVQVSTFAESYMNTDLGNEYTAHMKRENFPVAAVAKDLSEIKANLKWRKLKFPRAITLSGPPDAVSDLVTVEAIEGERGAEWTRVTIRGKLQAQE